MGTWCFVFYCMASQHFCVFGLFFFSSTFVFLHRLAVNLFSSGDLFGTEGVCDISGIPGGSH
jgi:hypothetical protein